MSRTEENRILLDVKATDVAFRAGQSLEQLLLDRALEVARQAGATVVTAKHVESCLDPFPLEQFLDLMRESLNGGDSGGKTVTGRPRQAA